MVIYLLQGLALGFAAAVQPGPFQAFLITQSLSHGWRRSLIAAFAPLFSDGPIIALVLLVLSQVPPWFERVLYLLGGVFILYLAWRAFKQWQDFELIKTHKLSGQQSLLRAALMNALSPGPYIFWSLITGPILIKGWREAPINGLGFLLGFYTVMIGINISIILLTSSAVQFGGKARRAMLGISSLALAGFGILQFWRGIAY